MPHQPLSPEVIIAMGVLLLILLLFIGMVAGGIYSIISQDKTNSKSGSETKPDS